MSNKGMKAFAAWCVQKGYARPTAIDKAARLQDAAKRSSKYREN